MGLRLLLDSLILLGLIKLICREETPEFGDITWAVGGMLLAHLLLFLFVFPILGPLTLLPALVIDSIWLSYMLHLSAKSGALLIMSFFSTKVALSFFLS